MIVCTCAGLWGIIKLSKLIGASLSEPHTSRTSVQSRYIYYYYYHHVACDLPYTIADQKCISYTHIRHGHFRTYVSIPYPRASRCTVTATCIVYSQSPGLQLYSYRYRCYDADWLSFFGRSRSMSFKPPKQQSPETASEEIKRERRLQRRREQARARRASETVEHRDERLRNRRVRDRAWRTDQTAAETAEESEARLQATRDRRAAESSEARETRLQRISSNQHERRASESAEARETRLQNVSSNQLERRASESA